LIEYENLAKANGPFIQDYRDRFEAVLRSGWFIKGEEVKLFEKEFADYCGARHCVGVANGLDALHLSLLALQLPRGSEVLVPSNAYIALMLAVLHAGLVPVAVEPDVRTCNIDPGRIEERLTPRTRAVMVVHLYGKLCHMDSLLDTCRRHGLRLIEDCAQAHGAAQSGKRSGSFGDLAAFSFYPTKNLGCLGDGGAVTTDDEELAARVRLLGNYGSRKKYQNEVVGFNSRLDELQAAFLRIKLRKLEEINSHKRRLAAEYRRRIRPGYVLPVEEEGFLDVYHIFNVRHPARDRLRTFLLERGIMTDIHYPISPNMQPAMRGVLDERHPISEEMHATTLSLPISFFHRTEDIVEVAAALNEFLDCEKKKPGA
jgi:dTDP-4-amino-4,6-dideoxygalactose transaminase